MQVRRAAVRGDFQFGWLDTNHTFSFGEYHDPAFMGYRMLRVINEDVVQPGQGFGMHPHRNMEIVTVVLSGALEHRDSLGNGEVLRPDELQRMSAGTGIRHSEFNPSKSEPVHLYQIWLLPKEQELKPSYEQRWFDPADSSDRWQLLASPQGTDDTLTIQTDASILRSRMKAGANSTYDIATGRGLWLQVLKGSIRVQNHELTTSDAIAIENESQLQVEALSDADLLLFDLGNV